MTREEHVQWCKTRADTYLNDGDIDNAYSSMASDLTKHPETEKHPAIMLGVSLMMIGELNTVEKMRKFIDGFN